jgi:hypothetical protein
VIALATSYGDIVDEVASALVATSVDGSSFVITTPLLYPGGSHVAVRIDGDGRHFFVSDDGGGYFEADLMGVATSYVRASKKLAEEMGVRFEDNCFFETGVNRDKLVIAAIAIANASKQAIDQTAAKLGDRSYNFDDNQLVDRLIAIFGEPKVHRKPDLLGASNRSWRFAAAVDAQGHQTVFDLVKPSFQSIMPAVAKFRDVSDLPDAPQRVAVLSDRKAFDAADYNLLSRSAKIIEFAAQDDTYRRAA